MMPRRAAGTPRIHHRHGALARRSIYTITTLPDYRFSLQRRRMHGCRPPPFCCRFCGVVKLDRLCVDDGIGIVVHETLRHGSTPALAHVRAHVGERHLSPTATVLAIIASPTHISSSFFFFEREV